MGQWRYHGYGVGTVVLCGLLCSLLIISNQKYQDRESKLALTAATDFDTRAPNVNPRITSLEEKVEMLQKRYVVSFSSILGLKMDKSAYKSIVHFHI